MSQIPLDTMIKLAKSSVPDKLTLNKLKAMQPEEIFATGTLLDAPDGLNMTNSRQMLRWVAVRGAIGDWAIYCHFADKDPEWIKRLGDKVYNERDIKRCVNCDEAAFKMYRI